MLNTPEILKFCCEEVTRQGHNINDLGDGFPRVVGMIRAWENALTRDKHGYAFTLADVRIWARHIEPIHNDGGFRTCGVQIGCKLCPPWEDVPRLMDEWLDHWVNGDEFTPDEVYLKFEYIHPFRDGNGRVGKIIHNWCCGTLYNPILVKDYFGGGNP